SNENANVRFRRELCTIGLVRSRGVAIRMINIENCRVVITGAARDMGRTLGICFAQLGAEVFLSARDVKAVALLRDELVERGISKVHAHACDLTQPNSIAAFAAA